MFLSCLDPNFLKMTSCRVVSIFVLLRREQKGATKEEIVASNDVDFTEIE